MLADRLTAMKLFRRAAPQPEPLLDNEGYRRWLRAQRPPLTWFLRLSVKEQEQLAILGDEYAQDLAIAVGFAVQDPKAAQAGILAAEGDAESEAILAEKIARNLVQRMAAAGMTKQQSKPSAPAEPSFAGIHANKPSPESEPAASPKTFLGATP